MTTLAADSKRDYLAVDGIEPALGELPVIASDIIYEGAAIGDNGSGYARPLAGSDPFRGFAARRADNSSGSAGDINVRTRRQGVVKLTVTGASAVTDVEKAVYATDDNVFTLTPGGTLIGKVTYWVSSTTCHVYFQASELQLGQSAATLIADPGASGSIVVARSGIVPLVSAAAEARTLPIPTFHGQEIVVYLKTDGGDVTLTVTSGYDQYGSTTLVFTAVQQFAKFLAVTTGTSLRWALVSKDFSMVTEETIQVQLVNSREIDETALAVFVGGASNTPGFQFTGAEVNGIRWNNAAAPDPIVLDPILLPKGIDDSFDATLYIMAAKTGATVGDAVTWLVTAFIQSDGALYDADADLGGTSSAMTGDATAKTVQVESLTLATADIPAGPCLLNLTIQPTDGTLGTDDVILMAVWVEYTPRRLDA